jgi:hypothetical protein
MLLAVDADTRRTRRMRRVEAELDDVMADIHAHQAKHLLPPQGKPPSELRIYTGGWPKDPGGNVSRPETTHYNRTVVEFNRLFGIITETSSPFTRLDRFGRGAWIDLRGLVGHNLSYVRDQVTSNTSGSYIAPEQRKYVGIVSLGDEVGFPLPGTSRNGQAPPLTQAEIDGQFVRWLQAKDLSPMSSGCNSSNWSDCHWSGQPYGVNNPLNQTNPVLFYLTSKFALEYGTGIFANVTSVLGEILPAARDFMGANFSPLPFVGAVFQWVEGLRLGAVTMGWSEDYAFQIPLATPQMNNLRVDMIRSGLRKRPNPQMMQYIMPHTPGNTAREWRMLLFSDLAHGVNIINLYCFNNVFGTTENNVKPGAYNVYLSTINSTFT